MEHNQQKYVNLSYIAASLLVAYVFYVLTTKFSVFLDFEGRFRALDKIILITSGVVGLGLFFGLYKSAIVNTFMNEVAAEIGKVTWPTQNETTKATIAVLIAVTIAGTLLWFVDSVWVYLISLLI